MCINIEDFEYLILKKPKIEKTNKIKEKKKKKRQTVNEIPTVY